MGSGQYKATAAAAEAANTHTLRQTDSLPLAAAAHSTRNAYVTDADGRREEGHRRTIHWTDSAQPLSATAPLPTRLTLT